LIASLGNASIIIGGVFGLEGFVSVPVGIIAWLMAK
jgi:hypothetical protein